MSGFARLLVKNTLNPPKDPKSSFAGKTIIVTGANTGLGYEAALKFVQKDAKQVILGVRSLEKGNAAKTSIESSTNQRGAVEAWELDMSSYSSIKRFADRASRLERLDIAVLNAGVYSTTYTQSQYGWETDLQVNTLSTALLSLLLLRKLKDSKTADHTPVLEIVASGRYIAVELSAEEERAENLLELFNQAEKFKAQSQYGASKLFVMYVVREIAKLAGPPEDPSVIVTSCCPGACKSDLAREYMKSWLLGLLIRLVMVLFLRTTEQGARSLVSGTVQGNKVHGQFWKDDKVQE